MAGTQYWGTGRWGTTQNVAYTGTAGTVATGVSASVYKIRVIVTTAAFVKVGDGTAATNADAYMAAGAAEYLTCTPGQKVSAIQVASGGTLYVTEVV